MLLAVVDLKEAAELGYTINVHITVIIVIFVVLLTCTHYYKHFVLVHFYFTLANLVCTVRLKQQQQRFTVKHFFVRLMSYAYFG